MLKLAGLFLITAVLYAAVGFGGGSTYNALLVLAGTDYLLLPSIALICNIIVVSGGTWRFHKANFIPWRAVWPLFVLSVPYGLDWRPCGDTRNGIHPLAGADIARRRDFDAGAGANAK